MSTTADVLREARRLYAEAPSHADPQCDPLPQEKHCPITAIYEAAGDDWDGIDGADRTLCLIVGTDDLAVWNAENSTETVLAAFDRAIEAES